MASPCIRRLAVLLTGILVFAVPGFPATASAQCPDPGTLIFPATNGTALQDSLRLTYRPPVGLSYGDARDVMFSELDNEEGMVSGIYTAFTVAVDPDSDDPKGDAWDDGRGLNTEHTWPQSKGAGVTPMRADLHHLFPSDPQANNDRGSFPFDEIPDEETDAWYYLRTISSSPDPELIDEYSELERRHPDGAYDGRWEPREERKGDVARAMFYFWTVYRAEASVADPRFFDVQKDDLRAWHKADPVDDKEYERTCAIAPHQDGKVNPFVIDPTLVDRAYFGGVPVRLARFEATASGVGVGLAWETTLETAHLGFNVIRSRGGIETRINAALVTADHGTYGFTDTSGEPGRVYDYWIESLGRDGSRERFGPRSVRYPESLLAVRPNPARTGQAVRFDFPAGGTVVLDLYDLRGRRVRRMTGMGELVWDGRDEVGRAVAPGVYFARFRMGETTAIRKLTIMR